MKKRMSSLLLATVVSIMSVLLGLAVFWLYLLELTPATTQVLAAVIDAYEFLGLGEMAIGVANISMVVWLVTYNIHRRIRRRIHP